MVGTRGVPAHYGGFETAIEEIGQRLAAGGHAVTVYCRSTSDSDTDTTSDGEITSDSETAASSEKIASASSAYLGMDRVVLPAVRSKALETLSHTGLSVLHTVIRSRPDVVFLFNSANSVFLPLLRARRIPTAVHVDGLEWQRAKWDGAGRAYYRRAESLAVRWADALIADAAGIAEYYSDEFGASTELLRYGAPILENSPTDQLAELDLTAGEFNLVVARFEPENHVDLIVRGYRESGAELPLVVVGSAPYGAAHTAEIEAAAAGDDRIRLVGPVWDQDLLDALYAHSLVYLHGHSVGGTNPSLLRAIGAGAMVAAFDVTFNREVLADDGQFFSDERSVAALVEEAEADRERCRRAGDSLRDRARTAYRWDDVADGYAALAQRLAGGESRRGEASGKRNDAPNWSLAASGRSEAGSK